MYACAVRTTAYVKLDLEAATTKVHLQPVGAITGGIVEALNFTVPFLVTQLATLTGTRSANDRIAKLHARQAAVKASTSNKLLC